MACIVAECSCVVVVVVVVECSVVLCSEVK